MINVVCAVIQDEQGRLLACQRPDGKTLAGKWEFPGGKIESGETPQKALCREIREELGCGIGVGSSLTTIEYHYSSFSIRLQPFLAEISDQYPQPIEHRELRWVTLQDCPKLDWAEADIPIWNELATMRNALGK